MGEDVLDSGQGLYRKYLYLPLNFAPKDAIFLKNKGKGRYGETKEMAK